MDLPEGSKLFIKKKKIKKKFMVSIRISRTVAEWMLRLSILLFQDGYNTNWHPANPELADYPDEGGLTDLVPMDNAQARDWIHSLMNLCRCLASILHHQLNQPHDEDELITFDSI